MRSNSALITSNIRKIFRDQRSARLLIFDLYACSTQDQRGGIEKGKLKEMESMTD